MKTVKILAISLLVLLINLLIYIGFEMRGDVNFLPMTSEFYGIPQHLKEKGIVPLFEEGGRGWDGQFYYFIANDLFDQK